ncbi:signal recognition particle 9 kDa protein-domain-containing protein [Hypoxylon sp. FL1284]|nr:signal recognition particle 9 kDa protein-domain-containing protein [Hypoxylon sp. FL1284]
MPYYATSQEWLHQSSLLLEARPTTTRITTKYHISKPKPRRQKKSSQPASSTAAESTAPQQQPRGSLTLKTYDPRSGACLKYRTAKAAEVSRLILSLGRPLAARMAALPLPEAADDVMADAPPAEEGGAPAVAGGDGGAAGAGGKPQGGRQQQGQQGGGGGGGKGKKKRNKK